MTCKFARRHGKDCESEVHVNLDFRIRPINCIALAFEMAVAGEHFCFILSGYLLTFQDILERLTVYRMGLQRESIVSMGLQFLSETPLFQWDYNFSLRLD